jgi:hypothetical protein
MSRPESPLERVLSRYWERDPAELQSLIEERFGVRVEQDQLSRATDAAALAAALKGQVDHPGRLERLAERLLRT